MYVVECVFQPDDGERLAARPAHRDKLAALKAEGTLVLGGPYADGSGSLVVLDVPDRAAVDAVLAADPYFSTPGVASVTVREWSVLDL